MTSTMTITEMTSTTGEQGRHQTNGVSIGRDVPCSMAPAVGSEVGCRASQPSPLWCGPMARLCPGSLPAWALVVAPNRQRGRTASASILSPCCRLFEYRGRVSPVPRVVPVKRPRVTIPLVRRVKATLPVKLFTRSAAIANSSAKLKCECVHGVQQVGAEPGAHKDLPSPGIPPQGWMAPGKTPQKQKWGNNSPSEGPSEV